MIGKLVAITSSFLVASLAPPVASSPAPVGSDYTLTAPVPLLLKWVPDGVYHMGDTSGGGEVDEHPVRRVTVEGFWIMDTEVTVAMYKRFIRAAGAEVSSGCDYFDDGWKTDQALSWSSPGFEQAPNHPVVCVSWQDAMAFSQWLSRETGLNFSLPSEAQWEYAARAGTSSPFAHGSETSKLCVYANGADIRALDAYPTFDVNGCEDGYTRTAPVGSYPANRWGLHDMTGNVWEWTADCWPADYALSSPDDSVFRSGDCERRGYRGGAYGDVPFFLRVSLRNRGYPRERRDDVGFRLVVNNW